MWLLAWTLIVSIKELKRSNQDQMSQSFIKSQRGLEQGWTILAYMQAIQYQYNNGPLVFQYNTIPIPILIPMKY